MTAYSCRWGDCSRAVLTVLELERHVEEHIASASPIWVAQDNNKRLKVDAEAWVGAGPASIGVGANATEDAQAVTTSFAASQVIIAPSDSQVGNITTTTTTTDTTFPLPSFPSLPTPPSFPSPPASFLAEPEPSFGGLSDSQLADIAMGGEADTSDDILGQFLHSRTPSPVNDTPPQPAVTDTDRPGGGGSVAQDQDKKKGASTPSRIGVHAGISPPASNRRKKRDISPFVPPTQAIVGSSQISQPHRSQASDTSPPRSSPRQASRRSERAKDIASPNTSASTRARPATTRAKPPASPPVRTQSSVHPTTSTSTNHAAPQRPSKERSGGKVLQFGAALSSPEIGRSKPLKSAQRSSIGFEFGSQLGV